MPRYFGGGAGTTYTGTANQVIVTDTVLSTPQDIATTSTPQFGGLGIGVAGVANKLMMPSGGIIDFAAADVTLTHAANALELDGGTLTTESILSDATLGRDIGSATRPFQSIYYYSSLNITNGTPNAVNERIYGSALASLSPKTVVLDGGTTNVPINIRYYNTNGAYEEHTAKTEAHTLAAAGTSTTATAVWPALSASLAASFRITTEITGCASVQVGVNGDPTRFGTFSTLTAGQTIAIGRVDNYTAQTGVLFTAVGGGAAFTAGAIRVNLRYHTASAPTS